MQHIEIAAVSILFMMAANAQPLGTGNVFHDADHDGKRGAGEKGIPNVCVSNGREVVQTDANGAWSLPVDDDTVFFVKGAVLSLPESRGVS